MDLTSTNIDELVGFQTNLKNTEKHFGRFDLLQIFQFVDPERNSDGSVLPTIRAGSKLRNIFQWYAVLTIEEVVASNEWYNMYTDTIILAKVVGNYIPSPIITDNLFVLENRSR
jgi:hypothetical protein